MKSRNSQSATRKRQTLKRFSISGSVMFISSVVLIHGSTLLSRLKDLNPTVDSRGVDENFITIGGYID
ncbi:MAG: hypothetical protein IPL12_22995 [Bacteroidetes bacterium]|nr:hypothetical protein [Bacteroidota bacterium]